MYLKCKVEEILTNEVTVSGIIRFAQTIKAYEKQDDEIVALNAKLRSIVMPQMAAPPPEPSGGT